MQPTNDATFDYDALRRTLQLAPDGQVSPQLLVDAPFSYKLETAMLFLGFICIYLVDDAKRQVYLAAASATEYYDMAVRDIDFKPADYRVSLDHTDNGIVKAITEGKSVSLTDWGTLSRRKQAEENARLNQASSGIAHSVIQPLPDGRGAIMYSYFQYQEQLGPEQQDFMAHYSAIIAKYLS